MCRTVLAAIAFMGLATSSLAERFFDSLNRMVQEEPVLPRDLVSRASALRRARASS
jgi:hypothetical protein